MTYEMVVAAFADAAERVKKAGMDFVQLHGASGYLINEFMSPFYNKRTDAYGGSLEGLLRFPIEVYRAVRARVGADFPVTDGQPSGIRPASYRHRTGANRCLICHHA